MFNPPSFRETRPDVLHAAIRAHPLATLVTHGPQGMSANLLPFVLGRSEDGGDVLRAHLTRTNSQLADLRAGAEALVIVQGPQAYITPSWYPTKAEHGKAVPTWNYVMVQLRGTPHVIDDPQWLRTQIDALTDQQESGLPDPWSADDAPAPFIKALLKGIVGLEILIERMEGKWKISQNQPAINRAGVVAGLRKIDAGCPMAEMIPPG